MAGTALWHLYDECKNRDRPINVIVWHRGSDVVTREAALLMFV